MVSNHLRKTIRPLTTYLEALAARNVDVWPLATLISQRRFNSAHQPGAIAIVEPGIWKGLLPEDHAFVIAWNSRNRHGESTKDIKIPTGVTLIPWSGTGPTDIKKLRRQITEAKSPTAAMKKADKKAISFGLQHEGDGDELEDVDIDLD